VRVLDTSVRVTPPPPPANPTSVSANGTIDAASGNASFSFNATKSKKKKWQGSFTYNDPAASVNIAGAKVTSPVVSGNQVHFTGSIKAGKKSKLTFTVNMIDNGLGASDTFSISLSTGYSDSGNLTSGDIAIH
jgi:hypothetical protein